MKFALQRFWRYVRLGYIGGGTTNEIQKEILRKLWIVSLTATSTQYPNGA